MNLHTTEDLTSCILDFQANIIRVTYRKKTTPVDPEVEPAHAIILNKIWESAGLEAEFDQNGHPLKWRKLGFDTEDMVHEFSEVGTLGLDCLVGVFYVESRTSALPTITSINLYKVIPSFLRLASIQRPFHAIDWPVGRIGATQQARRAPLSYREGVQ